MCIHVRASGRVSIVCKCLRIAQAKVFVYVPVGHDRRCKPGYRRFPSISLRSRLNMPLVLQLGHRCLGIPEVAEELASHQDEAHTSICQTMISPINKSILWPLWAILFCSHDWKIGTLHPSSTMFQERACKEAAFKSVPRDTYVCTQTRDCAPEGRRYSTAGYPSQLPCSEPSQA